MRPTRLPIRFSLLSAVKHYFFNVLGCWYTVPTDNGTQQLNGVP